MTEGAVRSRLCDECGGPLLTKSRGRPRVHCSKACARKAEKRRARLRARIGQTLALFEYHAARAEDRRFGAFHAEQAAALLVEIDELEVQLVEASPRGR